MADDEKKDYDLLLSLRRSICESLKAIEGLEQRRITLKLNKKLSWADFIVPALTRTCVGDPPGLGEDLCSERLVELVISCVLKIKFIRYCELTSSGHLLLKLDKAEVCRAVVHAVMTKGNKFGTPVGESTGSTLLNPLLFCTSHQENFNLDQMRTILICEHAQKLLQSNEVSVISLPLKYDVQRQSQQETYELFVPSCSSSNVKLWTHKDLFANMKELDSMLKTCKYVKSNSTALRPSCLKKSTSNAQNGDCGCEIECCAENMVLHFEEVQKESNHMAQGAKIPLSCSFIEEVAELELVASKTNSAGTLIHVTSCRKRFLQEQVGTVWDFVSNSPLAKKQVFFTHGLVTLNNDGGKVHDKLDSMGLLRLRESQLRKSYVLKYGDKVEGHGWEASIKQMAVSVFKLEILSVAPNSELKINVCETSREFRQATFVLYNCARLSKLFQNFEENVNNGVYPNLPPVDEVDFSLLRDEAEWELLLHFIASFPAITKDTVPTLSTKSQSFTIHTHKICCFLFSLSHKFSSYYGRVHILGESRSHLFPTMFARLYLMKALQKILHHCLELLSISSLTQM